MDMQRLRAYAELDQRRLALRREIDDIEAELKPLEAALLEEIATDGVPSMKVQTERYGLVTVYLDRKIWAKCLDEDWQRACEALKDAGLEDFVQPRYNTSTLSAYLRELDRQGEPLPESFHGAIEAEERLSVRTRRA